MYYHFPTESSEAQYHSLCSKISDRNNSSSAFQLTTERAVRFLDLPVPVLSHLQSKEVVPHIQVELPHSSSCPIAQHHREEPGSIFLTTSLPILIDIDKTEVRFLIQI